MMQILPSIDLLGGEVVRLRQGRAEEKTVYYRDPVQAALRWAAAGADWLHVVDLDGAFTGEQRNLAALERIAAAVPVPVQAGGGMRSLAHMQRALDAGAARVIIGTRALEGDLVQAALDRFGPERVLAGIDARGGVVLTNGWVRESQVQASDLWQRLAAMGVPGVIYTDVRRDGMLQGPNFDAIAGMAAIAPGVIASGGVSSVDDVRRLAATPGVVGAILGKAIYEGTLDIKAAKAAC